MRLALTLIITVLPIAVVIFYAYVWFRTRGKPETVPLLRISKILFNTSSLLTILLSAPRFLAELLGIIGLQDLMREGHILYGPVLIVAYLPYLFIFPLIFTVPASLISGLFYFIFSYIENKKLSSSIQTQRSFDGNQHVDESQRHPFLLFILSAIFFSALNATFAFWFSWHYLLALSEALLASFFFFAYFHRFVTPSSILRLFALLLITCALFIGFQALVLNWEKISIQYLLLKKHSSEAVSDRTSPDLSKPFEFGTSGTRKTGLKASGNKIVWLEEIRSPHYYEVRAMEIDKNGKSPKTINITTGNLEEISSYLKLFSNKLFYSKDGIFHEYSFDTSETLALPKETSNIAGYFNDNVILEITGGGFLDYLLLNLSNLSSPSVKRDFLFRNEIMKKYSKIGSGLMDMSWASYGNIFCFWDSGTVTIYNSSPQNIRSVDISNYPRVGKNKISATDRFSLVGCSDSQIAYTVAHGDNPNNGVLYIVDYQKGIVVFGGDKDAINPTVDFASGKIYYSDSRNNIQIISISSGKRKIIPAETEFGRILEWAAGNNFIVFTVETVAARNDPSLLMVDTPIYFYPLP